LEVGQRSHEEWFRCMQETNSRKKNTDYDPNTLSKEKVGAKKVSGKKEAFRAEGGSGDHHIVKNFPKKKFSFINPGSTV